MGPCTQTLPETGVGRKRSMLEAALSFAAEGWAIVPLYEADAFGGCTCSLGGSCNNSGKHPRTRHGVRDATCNPEKIRQWWDKWPSANIGGATGRPSDRIVLDLDPRNGSVTTFAALETQHGPFPLTRTHATGGGGEHRIFRYPDLGNPVRSRVLGAGVELLSDGKLVVLPESFHVSRRWYAIADDREPAELPIWPREYRHTDCDKTREKAAKTSQRPPNDQNHQFADTIPQGARNNTLTREGGRLRRRGMGPAEINTALQALNRDRCRPPLSEHEVARIARSICRYPPGVIGRQLARIVDAIERTPWRGREGGTDRAVLLAHVAMAADANAAQYHASNRDVGERAGVHRSTPMRAHRRLIAQGWLVVQDPDGTCEPVRAGAPAKHAQAWRWALRIPQPSSATPATPAPEWQSGRTVQQRLDLADDAFRWLKALGKNAPRVLDRLANSGGATCTALAARLGLHRSTVWRILVQCAGHDLVSRDARDHWVLRDLSRAALVRVACRCESVGKADKERQKHAMERAEHREGSAEGFAGTTYDEDPLTAL
jgi:hypothetical protein